ncbi:hypothetical protein CHUAL_000964 [Chamberlinius hualienensis]
MADVAISKDVLESFVCSANKAIHILLARTMEDVDDDCKQFHPEFSHQLFGDSECIFGYKDLKVNLFYSASWLTTYLSMTYSEKVSNSKLDVQPDEVLKIIHEKLQSNYLTSEAEFIKSIAKDTTFAPFGELIRSFTVEKDGCRTFEIYAADISTPGFCDYHERIQTFLLWFVDAASFINTDDDRWRFYLVFEKYKNSQFGKDMYAFSGYATVYHYFAYPKHTRPRISQLLILPPFQRNGLGAELLNAIYKRYISDKEVIDITVEDPSEQFTRLRDFVDAKNISALPSFSKEFLKNGFTTNMAEEAQQLLKINKRQARRIYEILRLRYTNVHDEKDYRTYRLCVKNRLNAPFQRQKTELNKLQKTLRPEEFRVIAQLDTRTSQRIEQLEGMYKELEEEYHHVLDKINI